MKMSINTMFYVAGITHSFFTPILFDALGSAKVLDENYNPTQKDWDTLFAKFREREDAVPNVGFVDAFFGETTQAMRTAELNDFHVVFCKVTYALIQCGFYFAPPTHSSD